MFYKLDFEFSNPNNSKLLDAYVGLREVPLLQTVLIGNQVRPLGLEVFSSSKNSVFMENALVFGASNVDARRITRQCALRRLGSLAGRRSSFLL